MSAPPPPLDADSGARGVTLAAALLAASVLLSRALGLVRDAVLAHQVGAGSAADAYNAAFQIPDILNYFLAGGALSIALVPLYTRTRARQGQDEAIRLFHTILGTMGVAVVAATALLVVFAPELVALQFPRFGPEQQALTTRLTRIVLPAQCFFVVGGVMKAVLMSHGRFFAQATAPLIYNLGIIAGGVLLGPRIGVEGFAWGALVGAALGPFGAAVVEIRGRVPLGFRFAPFDRSVGEYLMVAAPLMLGVTLLTVDEWYDRWFGQLGGEGTIAVLGYARRLMQVPVAVVGQAVATAALPTLARLFSEGRREELDRLLLATLRAGIGLGLVCGGATWALAEPAVRVVYGHGAFTGEDVLRASATLSVFAFAVPAWIAQQIAVRAFYARGDTWRPMLLGTAVALLAIPLYLALAPRGETGLAAAGAFAVTGSALATLVLARLVHGGPKLAGLAGGLLRTGAVALAATLVTPFVLRGGDGLAGAALDLALGGVVFLAVATLGLMAIGDPDARAAWLGLARRVRGGRGS